MKVVYLHHPNRHFLHAKYAESIGADFLVQDYYFSYSNHTKWHKTRRYISLILLLIKFPYKKYDAVLTDEPALNAMLLKTLSSGRLKLITTQASITLNKYFENKLSFWWSKAFKRIYNNYDLVIALGDIQYSLAKKMCISNNKIKIVKSFNGVSTKYVSLRDEIKYDPLSKKVIAIAFVTSEEIFFIKGIDIMIEVFIQLKKENPELQFVIVGNIAGDIIQQQQIKYDLAANSILFAGKSDNIETYCTDAVCAFHFSRKDAFPLAVIEMMNLGLPVILSNQVGCKFIYEEDQQLSDLIVDITDHENMLSKVKSFLLLSSEEKKVVSQQIKNISSEYTEINAIKNYQKIVKEYFDSIKVKQ